MTLFSRLFHRKADDEPAPCRECSWPPLEGTVQWNTPEFDKRQVRLVVFKDHALCGRTLLFDSKATKRVTEDAPSPSKPCCSPKPAPKPSPKPSPCAQQPKYQISKPGSDTKMLGEMMFGSVAMSYQGSSIKVHSIRCPPQLMFTKILIPSVSSFSRRTPSWDDFDSYSLQSSFSDVTSDSHIFCKERASSHPELSRSVPMEIPSPLLEREDSGLSTSLISSGSLTPVYPSSPSCNGQSSINSCSYKSFQRRWHRSQQTCLEFGVRSRHSDLDSDSGPQSLPTPTCKKSCKLGVGILVTLYGESNKTKNQEFVELFFSHITLLERHVENLSQSVEKAFINKKQFIHSVMESLDTFCDSLIDLFLTPRLTQPVWLNMMSARTNRQIVCQQFLTEFTHLVDKYELKENNFFISKLLTAVLTYHLAWVPTVTPSGVLPSRVYLDKHSAKWLDTLAHSHPYNPLWAQLSDLYGAIGYPLKLSRTVIVGKNQSLVCALLYVLSYFIRCSEVYESTPITEPEFPEFEDTEVKYKMNPILESGKIRKENDDIRDSGISVTSVTAMDDKNRQGWTIGEEPIVEGATAHNVTFATEVMTSGNDLTSVTLASTSCGGVTSTPSSASPTSSGAPSVVMSPTTPVTSFNPIMTSSTSTPTTPPPPSLSPSVDLEDPQTTSPRFHFPADDSVHKTEKLQNPESKPLSVGNSTFYIRPSHIKQRPKVLQNGNICNTKRDEKMTLNASPEVVPNASTPPIDMKTPTSPGSGTGSSANSTNFAASKLSPPVGSPDSVGSLLARQVTRTSAPARCKSLTPTELNRRRHLSSGSVESDADSSDPFLSLRDITLPPSPPQPPTKEFPRNFGHSLMAGISDHYLSDFVLHGTCDPHVYKKLEDDLTQTAKASVLDETMSEASCVVGDTDECQVYVLASTQNEKMANPSIQPSQMVADLVESVSQLWTLRMPPEFCLMHLEDRLQEIYFKSRMLAEYLRQQKHSNIRDLTDVLGFHCSDLPVLLAVAGTHSPELSFGIS